MLSNKCQVSPPAHINRSSPAGSYRKVWMDQHVFPFWSIIVSYIQTDLNRYNNLTQIDQFSIQSSYNSGQAIKMSSHSKQNLVDIWEGWKQKSSKCYWTNKQIESFCIHTQKLVELRLRVLYTIINSLRNIQVGLGQLCSLHFYCISFLL